MWNLYRLRYRLLKFIIFNLYTIFISLNYLRRIVFRIIIPLNNSLSRYLHFVYFQCKIRLIDYYNRKCCLLQRTVFLQIQKYAPPRYKLLLKIIPNKRRAEKVIAILSITRYRYSLGRTLRARNTMGRRVAAILYVETRAI